MEKGEVTIFAGYDWRLERKASIAAGSGDSLRKRSAVADSLLGTTVSFAGVTGRIPELQLAFSNGIWLSTFATQQGQPDWSVSFNLESPLHLCVERGVITLDRRGS